MSATLAIARREVLSSFVTPLAYVVIASFLLLCGFFFFSLLQNYNSLVELSSQQLPPGVSIPAPNLNYNEWLVTPYFHTLEIVLVFLLPLLTMHAVAEERRRGTYELLATSPVSVSELVLGKFLGVFAVVVLMLAGAAVFPGVLLVFADPEVMPIFVGFFGLLLFAMGFSAVGVAISCSVKEPTVAGVISLVAFLLGYMVDVPVERFGAKWAAFINYFGPTHHTEQLLRGMLYGSDVAYFLSLTVFGLFVASRMIELFSE